MIHTATCDRREMLRPLGRAAQGAVLETLDALSAGEVLCLGTVDREPPADGLYVIISFQGAYSWSLIFGFPPRTAERLVEAMIGMPLRYDDPDMNDAAGEFANIICGDLVARLEQANITARMGLPTVARGSDVELTARHEMLVERVAFSGDVGPFWFKIVLAPEETAHNSACPFCRH